MLFIILCTIKLKSVDIVIGSSLYSCTLAYMHKYFRGQQLAQQMQNANPELIESLRRQMGGNPNDPEPPQQN